ncbi:hypothetical protein ABEF92_007001 [Exophiala dermatitidis]|uniref:Uncharacterized protein n=1 Tax=Exophiala dermatitidis (strain ATCC 34100 / CBS 525.76 / NIH/UT8656) TaxID=858893 RepID=H6C072_EXODN|nr:uncharacterized protein HMPREF1120_04437 [Exophiala dermatitidis NIH/UT8656]EHY56355.1 hypothetical protein HMPREF1120_04437 [Exophiala dermatitidis NIH/UT8656]
MELSMATTSRQRSRDWESCVGQRAREASWIWVELTARDEVFKETVAEWLSERRWNRLKPKHSACLIVGMLLCQDVTVARSEEDARTTEAGGGIPLGTVAQTMAAAHGVGLATQGVEDVSGQVSCQDANRAYFAASGQGTKIFALDLRLTTSQKGNLKLTDRSPRAPSDRRLGPDDDEDEVDPESLSLGELDDADWASILDDEYLGRFDVG